MIRRSVKPSKKLSFFLFGARGTGKSTWLQEAFLPEEHLWIDLTNPKEERRYARKPEILLDEWHDFTKSQLTKSVSEPWIVIDEVQKIPAILDVVHVGIQRHKIKFALTGSSARKLKRGAANLLAGRALTYRMHPFTYSELGGMFRLDDYLQWGGLPMIQGIDSPDDRRRYLSSYVDTYLREEIQIEQLVRKIEPFRMFLDVVGQMNGEIINIAKLAKQAEIDPKSGERYFEILNDTLVGFYLPAFDRSIRKAQLKHPKFYMFDVGVARAIRGELSLNLEPHTGAYGRCFEHFVVQQIFALNDYHQAGWRLSYLRTKDGNEVDLVIERPEKPLLFVEIKSSNRPESLNLNSFRSLAKDAKAEAVVICTADRAMDLDNIRAMPWRQCLEDWFS
ncbi:MAG: AAA family ATPase [Pseudomonadota bacterium]